MTDAKYRETQLILIEIWIWVQNLDLDGFIERDECEGTTPLFDPPRIKAWVEITRALRKGECPWCFNDAHYLICHACDGTGGRGDEPCLDCGGTGGKLYCPRCTDDRSDDE